MAIAYQDFSPTLLKESMLSSVHEELPAVVARANNWVERHTIQIINAQTVIGLKTQETIMNVRNQSGCTRCWFIRVWL